MTRVHVVEDSRTQAMELMILLEELGYEASHSDRLSKGIEHVNERGADIVLLDLMLPDSERLATLSTLLDALQQSVPIVVLTVLADKELAIEALSLGAQDYINKGRLDADVLDRTLRYAIERHRTHAELIMLTETLRRQNEELEQLNAVKNQFLGMATHDLRNPLNVIFAYSQILLTRRMRGNLTDKQIDMVESIQRSCSFMRRLINDLLDISTIESGHLELNPAPTDLGLLFSEAVERLGMLAERKGVDLRLVLPDDPLPPFLVDAHTIEQVLTNLVDNAVKFSDSGQSVEVRLSVSSEKGCISIVDSGPGIAPDDLEALFQPFGTKGTGTAGERGTGLGLAIVRKIVDSHGGAIDVDSTVGEGTTFNVLLPLA